MSTVNWPVRISSDEDTVDRFLHNEEVAVEAPDIADLNTAIEWLALYGASDADEAQPYANVIGFLQRTIETRLKRKALAAAKRAYAAEHNIPVSQVRVSR